MAEWRRKEEQTKIHNTLYRKVKIEQDGFHKNPGVNLAVSVVKAFPVVLHLGAHCYSCHKSGDKFWMRKKAEIVFTTKW